MRRPLALMFVVLALPLAAQASIGKVSELEGKATRTPEKGPAVSLKTDSEVDLGDTLAVDEGGNLKLTLDDGSVLLVAGGSQLHIDQARFGKLERHFSARLVLGAVWAAVTKVASGASSSFEISTPRAVAGVRGTVFQVDAGKDDTTVGVEEGEVWVNRPGPAGPAQATPPPGTGTPTTAPAPSHEVLRAGQALRVNRAGFRRLLIARAFKRAAFARFIARRRARILQRRRRFMGRAIRRRMRRRQRRRRRLLRRRLRRQRLHLP